MAQKITVILEDDLVGGEANETINFSVDNTAFEIDLNSANAEEFKAILEKYSSAGRRVTKARKSPAVTAAAPRTGPLAKDVRAWAVSNGVEVNERGRIGQEIVDQYLAATA